MTILTFMWYFELENVQFPQILSIRSGVFRAIWKGCVFPTLCTACTVDQGYSQLKFSVGSK